MTERNTGGGNLIIAIIIALIVGLAVYFLIDAKPAGEPHPENTTGDVLTTGVTSDVVT